MELWVGDFVRLQDEINYYKFKLSTLDEIELQRIETRKELEIREKKAKGFRLIVNTLEGIERTVFLKKYVENKVHREIAEELNLSKRHIDNTSKELQRKISFAIKLLKERDKELE